MPDSWYEQPDNELEHDDECEWLDEDNLASDEDATEDQQRQAEGPPDCKCEQRLADRMEEGQDPDEGRDDDWQDND